MARQKKRKTARLSFWSWLVKLFNWLGLLVLFILILAVGWWSIGPRFYSYSSSKNILLFSKNNDGLVNNYYLAEYLELPGENLLVLSPIELGESPSTFSSTAVASWQLGVIIDQFIELGGTTTTLADYQQLRRAVRAQFWRQPTTDSDERLKLMNLLFTLRSLDSTQVECKTQHQPNLFTPREAEGCSLAVVNTTAKAGLATQTANLLEQTGARVVRVADRDQPEPVTSLIYDSTQNEDQTCQFWAKRIQAIFPQEVLENDDLEVRQRQRADLVIILGKDLLVDEADD